MGNAEFLKISWIISWTKNTKILYQDYASSGKRKTMQKISRKKGGSPNYRFGKATHHKGLELPSRLELPTSSLPRRYSTCWVTEANIQFCTLLITSLPRKYSTSWVTEAYLIFNCQIAVENFIIAVTLKRGTLRLTKDALYLMNYLIFQLIISL